MKRSMKQKSSTELKSNYINVSRGQGVQPAEVHPGQSKLPSKSTLIYVTLIIFVIISWNPH